VLTKVAEDYKELFRGIVMFQVETTFRWFCSLRRTIPFCSETSGKPPRTPLTAIQAHSLTVRAGLATGTSKHAACGRKQLTPPSCC